MSKKQERIDIYLYCYCQIHKSKLSSAEMTIFEIESTNLKNSFTKSIDGYVNMNPLIADSEGNFPKAFVNKPYKVEINDSNGVRVFGDSYE